MNSIGEYILLVLAIIANGWIVYWVQYMNKKGDNKAMQEDITDLTNQVEEVKKIFNEDLEKVKADLSLFTSQKFSLSSEERSSIFKYFDAYNRWLNGVSYLNMNEYTNENYEKFSAKCADLNCDVEVAESMLQIFVTSDDYLETTQQINDLTIQMKMLTDELFFKCQQVDLDAKKFLLDSGTGANMEKYRGILQKKVLLFEKYGENQREKIFEKLYPLLVEMRRILKKHLLETLKIE